MRNTKQYPITLEEKIRALKKAIDKEHSNPSIGGIDAWALTLVMRDLEKSGDPSIGTESKENERFTGKLASSAVSGDFELAIPASITQSLFWQNGDEVELSVTDGKLVVVRVDPSE
jgi:hypothetical protein